jgi:hypothetical protein
MRKLPILKIELFIRKWPLKANHYYTITGVREPSDAS